MTLLMTDECKSCKALSCSDSVIHGINFYALLLLHICELEEAGS